ncbi:hypothetical protein DMB38_21885 [Streptomyces sp. WAC 06738]|uniref:hypothetical protein n=1 Tax=Streptomyces sp. WAC 06738 TaxID=2203210 RepID=UPI000F6DD36A|nr:hypothetical protein [Streptomyces sp. WAC 06738]AZM48081.1 hypothetical protein DMB38_21885 [Streptomyces sp. WAC 06738]
MQQPATSRVRVLPNADGRLEIFGRAGNKTIYHRWQTAPGNGWNQDEWQQLDGSSVAGGEPVAAMNRDGRMDVYVRGTGGELYVRWQVAPSNGWNAEGWRSLGQPPGGALAADPVVTQNADGRLHAFVRSTDNTIWHKWQKPDNTGYRDIWEQLPDRMASNLVVARNADGRLEIFAIDNDGVLRNLWQTHPDGDKDWVEEWGTLDGRTEDGSPLTLRGNPSAGLNQDGRLDVYALGADGELYVRWQVAPSNGWNEGWRSLGRPPVGELASDPVVAQNADGRLEIFCLGPDQAIWHIWQINPSDGWSSWESLGGNLTSAPAVARNSDGRLDVYARGTEGTIMVRWQGVAGSGWNPAGWQSMGGEIVDF